jgi:hypothetical protein
LGEKTSGLGPRNIESGGELKVEGLGREDKTQMRATEREKREGEVESENRRKRRTVRGGRGEMGKVEKRKGGGSLTRNKNPFFPTTAHNACA